MSIHNKYALITGASHGIGSGLAEQCAARGFNVLLVALPDENLEARLQQLQQRYPYQSFDALGIDLSQPDSAQQIFEWCHEKEYSIQVLINNVGMGNAGPFLSRSAEFYFSQMQLNMTILVMLTHFFLPALQKEEKAYILNVSSLAAFYDIPYKSVYAASKRFVYSFSRSLRKELESTSVSVTALCPAAVMTNADVIQRGKELGRAARWTQQSIEMVAEYALKYTLKGKAVAVPGLLPKIYRRLSKLVPYPLQMRLLANAFIKQSR
jgi:hypothetical protein